MNTEKPELTRTKEYEEAFAVFSALNNYKESQSLTAFKKLCIKIEDLLNQIFASTKTNEERDVFLKSIDKFKNI